MATLKPSTTIYKTIVRSLSPVAIGAVMWSAQRFGFHVNAGTASEIAMTVGATIAVVIPPLERKWLWFGVFLGWIGAPTFTPITTKADLEKQVAILESQLQSAPYPAPGTPISVTVTPNA